MKRYEVRVTIPEQRVEVWARTKPEAEKKAFWVIGTAGLEDAAQIVASPLKAEIR